MRLRAALALAATLVALAAPAPAAAAVDEAAAIRAADRDAKVVETRREHPGLGPSAAMVDGRWEVSYFAGGERLVLAIVDPGSGAVVESWTGHQVDWKMARGYSGAFGRALNAPYVFLPLCALFLIGLVDWRRPRRIVNLDLLALLAFGVSHFFFNRGEIGVSVPLQYAPLLYLLGRCLWIGLRGGGEGLRPAWPASRLLVAALFLLGFRVGLNVADAGVIDVGYAGVVGADRITHGEAIYDNFPADFTNGDTYGPLNYLAYVPFELVWPWSGSWDDLPAAHAAAVAFDLATFVLLVLLGSRLRPGAAGRRLAATLGFGWAAYPYTAYVLESNANDALVSALLVATLLLLARPAARGAALALAAWAKFAPAVLAPMLLTCGPGPGRRRTAAAFLAGFGVVTVLALAWPALDPGLATLYERTVGTQTGRDSPFSVWGQAPSLDPLRTALLAALAALSVAFALRPRRKTERQVAALGAALLILLQLTLQHWFYLYIVWFFPLLLVALALPRPTSDKGRGLTYSNIDIYSGGGCGGEGRAPFSTVAEGDLEPVKAKGVATMSEKAHSGKATVTLRGVDEILIAREFDAPRHLVYRAYTTPELVKRWWSGRRGRTTSVEIDLRVGGRWRYAMVADEGFEVAFHGEFKEIVPEERIVNTEVYEAVPDAEALVTVTFEEIDGRTKLTALMQMPSREVRDMAAEMMEAGVQEAYDLLEEVAAAA